MIGLIVMRGYPHSVIEAETFAHPVGQFQKRDIEQRLAVEEKSIEQWVALGESASRPIKPENPAFERALQHAAKAKDWIVVDNVFRLYDSASPDSAKALTAFLQEKKYPLISAVHGKPVHFNPVLFSLLLADRMQYASQNEQVPVLKKELKLTGRRKPPTARPEVRQEVRDRNWIAVNRKIQNAVIGVLKSYKDDNDRVTIDQLCAELNEQGYLTETGLPWKPANLRKKLKRLREGTSSGKMWEMIEL